MEGLGGTGPPLLLGSSFAAIFGSYGDSLGAGGGDLFLCRGSRLRGSSLRLGSSFFLGSDAISDGLFAKRTF